MLAKPGVPTSALSSRYATTWYSRQTTFDDLNRVATQQTGAQALVQGYDNVAYNYTPRGQIASMSGALSSYGTLLQSASYAPDGALVSAVLGDAALTTITPQYDSRRLVHEMTVSSSNFESRNVSTYQPVLEDDVFGYDPVGNPTSITDQRVPSAWPPEAQPASRTISYDTRYEVTHVGVTPGGLFQNSPFAFEALTNNPLPVAWPAPTTRVATQDFTYDALGNTLSSQDDQSSLWSRSLGTITNGGPLAGPNQLQSSTQTGAAGGMTQVVYDPAGNVSAILVQAAAPCTGSCQMEFVYDWDELGRLARARRFDGGASTPTVDDAFAYDAGGQRVLKATSVRGGDALLYGVHLPVARARWSPVAPPDDRRVGRRLRRHRADREGFAGGSGSPLLFDGGARVGDVG